MFRYASAAGSQQAWRNFRRMMGRSSWSLGGRWWLCVLAVAAVSATHSRPAPAASAPMFPIFEVHEVESGDRPTFEIALIAPPRWSNGSVRTGLLRKAAMVAASREARCFAIERAQINRDVSYVSLRSGHMTISRSESAAEWRRYWHLYRHVLDSPGIHFGLGTEPRTGNKVVEGRMVVRLCGPDAEASGDLFEVGRILSQIRSSESDGSR